MTPFLIVFSFLNLLIANVSSHSTYNHQHAKRSPTGYRTVYYGSSRLPTSDAIISQRALKSSESLSTCANICTQDADCYFFSMYRTKSSKDSSFCGWWSKSMTPNDVTEAVTDSGDEVVFAEGYNKVVAAGSSASAATVSNVVSKSTSSVMVDTSTSRDLPTSTASAAGPDSTPDDDDDAPPAIKGYKNVYSNAKAIPAEDTMIDYWHGVVKSSKGTGAAVRACAKKCSKDDDCLFFTVWTVHSTAQKAEDDTENEDEDEDVLYCATYSKVFARKGANVRKFVGGKVRDAMGYKKRASK